jgi:hypothetical protein
MWIEITPRRPDFCGCPPCTLCYRWGEDNGVGMSGLEKMSLELTGKFLDELTPIETTDLKAAADRIHSGALMTPLAPLAEPPPQVDLGMSDAVHMDGWLAQHKPSAAPIKPVQLTLDQRDDWQEPIVQEAAMKEAGKVLERALAEQQTKEAPKMPSYLGGGFDTYLQLAKMQQVMLNKAPSKGPPGFVIIDELPPAKIIENGKDKNADAYAAFVQMKQKEAQQAWSQSFVPKNPWK